MSYGGYAGYGGRRSPTQGDSGMYSRDRSPPRDSFSGRRSPMGRIPKISSTSSLDDLRTEFNRITDDTPLKMEDMTWEKMGSKVQDMLEAKANGM